MTPLIFRLYFVLFLVLQSLLDLLLGIISFVSFEAFLLLLHSKSKAAKHLIGVCFALGLNPLVGSTRSIALHLLGQLLSLQS